MSQTLLRFALLTCLLSISSVGMIAFQQDDPDTSHKPSIKIQPKAQPDKAQDDKSQLPRILPSPKLTPSQSAEKFAPLPSDEVLHAAIRKVGESLGWGLVHEKPEEGLFIWRLRLASCGLPDVKDTSQSCDGRMVWYVQRTDDALMIWNPLSISRSYPMGDAKAEPHDQIDLSENSMNFFEAEGRIMQLEYIERFRESIGHVNLKLFEPLADELQLHKEKVLTALKQTNELQRLPIVLNDTVIVVKDQAQLSANGKTIQTFPRGLTLDVRGFDDKGLKVCFTRPGVIQRSDVLPLNEGIELFTKEITNNPQDSNAYRCRGSAWRAKGDYKKAISDLDRAIKLNPNDAFAFRIRGMAQEFQHNYQSAISDYTSALELNPDHAVFLTDRSVAYTQIGELDQALDDLNAAIKSDPQYSMAYNNRAGIWWGMVKDDRALADFNEAIRLDPEFANAYLNRANYWADRGEEEKFHEDLNTAISLNPLYLMVLYDMFSEKPEE